MPEMSAAVSRAPGASSHGLIRITTCVASAVASLVLVVSLIGPTWLHSPADPATGAPAADLSYQDLRQVLNVAPATNWQHAYFGWLAWLLVAVTIVVLTALWLRPSRLLGLGLTALALTGLTGSVFAVKGMLTWSQFVDAAPDVRLGGYLVFTGFVIALALGVLTAIRRS